MAGRVANGLQVPLSQWKQSEQFFASVADCPLKVIDCIPVVQLLSAYFSAAMTIRGEQFAGGVCDISKRKEYRREKERYVV